MYVGTGVYVCVFKYSEWVLPGGKSDWRIEKGISEYVSGFLREFLTVLVRGYMNDPDAVARHIPPHLSRKKCGAQETPLGVHSITWQCTLSHTFQVK